MTDSERNTTRLDEDIRTPEGSRVESGNSALTAPAASKQSSVPFLRMPRPDPNDVAAIRLYRVQALKAHNKSMSSKKEKRTVILLEHEWAVSRLRALDPDELAQRGYTDAPAAFDVVGLRTVQTACGFNVGDVVRAGKSKPGTIERIFETDGRMRAEVHFGPTKRHPSGYVQCNDLDKLRRSQTCDLRDETFCRRTASDGKPNAE